MNWNKWEAIGQLAGATATLAAVIVSLRLARSATRAKATMFAGVMLQTGPGPVETWRKLVVFRIQNIGQRPMHIEMIGFRTGSWPFRWPKQFGRQQAIIPLWDPGVHTHPPFDLQPYRKTTSALLLDEMIDGIIQMTGAPFFARFWPLIGLQRTPVFAVMHLEEGGSITQRVNPELEEALFQAEVARQARLAATPAAAPAAPAAPAAERS